MELKLSGKRAIVCGASQGIGRAIAFAFAEEGINLCLLSRTESKLLTVAEELRNKFSVSVSIIAIDIVDHLELEKKLKSDINENGDIQIVINNTGGPKSSLVLEAGTEDYLTAFKAHILSAQLIVNLCLDGMRKDSYGRIINIISTSVKQPIPNLGVSNTIRAAMASWAKTLSRELDPFVTINNVLPGFTETERLKNLANSVAEKTNKTVETVYNEWKSTIPVKRFAQAEELAAAVTFLASMKASYINGINLPVDGGRLTTL